MEKDLKISTITLEQLWANGWEKTGDPVIPAKKCLTDKEDENYNPDEGEVDMVVHRHHNCDMFALALPNGTMVNINPTTIEELMLFEELILSVDIP